MPVYVFECNVCGATFERKSNMNDDLSEVICPNGHTKVHRIYSVPTVIFKGSGFYVNDNRSKVSKASYDQRT
jgi:putative FmdB family regulatory protein